MIKRIFMAVIISMAPMFSYAVDLTSEITSATTTDKALYDALAGAITDVEDKVDGIDLTEIQDAIDKADEAITLANGYASDIADAKADAAQAKTDAAQAISDASDAKSIASTAQTIAAGANATAALAYRNTEINASAISDLDDRVTDIENSGGGGGTVDTVARNRADEAYDLAFGASVSAGLASGTATNNKGLIDALDGRLDDAEDRLDALEASSGGGGEVIDIAARARLDVVESDVNDIDDRVTALENASSFELPDYSIGAARTGRKWVDGKDEYFKVVVLGGMPNDSTPVKTTHSENIDTVISYEGVAVNPNTGHRLKLDYAGADLNGYFSVALDVDNTDITVTSSTDVSSYTSGHVIMYFTRN